MFNNFPNLGIGMKLKVRVAVVTRATLGMGQAISEREGAKVVIADFNVSRSLTVELYRLRTQDQ